MTEIILVTAAFLTATISAMIGMAGGIMLFAVMASFLPPPVLIPIHGVTQFGSNLSRCALNFKDIKLRILMPFAIGAVLGSSVGSQFISKIHAPYYTAVLGVFILVITWMPKPQRLQRFKGKFFILGIAPSFLSLLFGAVGLLAAPFYLNEGLKKEELIATKASTQVVVHAFKIVIFFFSGFAFSQYWQLMSYLLVAVVLGAYCGKLLLTRVNEKLFYIAFRTVITLLAFRLIVIAFI